MLKKWTRREMNKERRQQRNEQENVALEKPNDSTTKSVEAQQTLTDDEKLFEINDNSKQAENTAPPIESASSSSATSSSSSSTSPPTVTLDVLPPMVNNHNLTNESIYEFYVEQLWPALQASLPILFGRLGHDLYTTLQLTGHRVLTFLLPWLAAHSNHNHHNINNINNNDNHHYYDVYDFYHSPQAVLEWSQSVASRLAANMTLLWEQAMASSSSSSSLSSSNSTSIHDVMLRNFDTNQDGHISPSEFVNMTEHFVAKLLQQAPPFRPPPLPPSFWAWFSREWPLMDWKVGLFVWRSCGGLLLVISILTIIPGRLHGISGRILRWPILAITYFLIGVELMVYIVIRVFIRMAEVLIAHPKHRHLRRQLRRAKSYDEWYHYAQQLDKSQRRDVWQQSHSLLLLRNGTTTTTYRYNWSLIQELMTDMKRARETNDSLLALAVLQQCTRKNVGGIMSEELFSYTNTGESKTMVKEFVQEVVATLHWVTDAAVNMSSEANKKDDELVLPPPIVEEARAPMDNDDEDDDVVAAVTSVPAVGAHHVYEEHLQRKVKKEKDKIWRSLVTWATLTFQDPNNSNGNNSNGNSPSKTAPTTPEGNVNKQKPRLSSSASSTSSASSSSSHGMGDVLAGATTTRHATATAAALSADQTTRNFPTFHRETVLTLLKRARAAYGRTALCLSGGAMMGNYHWGHVKALLEEGILPHIISGTSAGSVVGAILCTRTDEELKRDLAPEVLVHKLTCFSRPWMERAKSVVKNGHMFDVNDWLDLIQWFTCGNLTFEEAYQKTGRVFCITLSATTKKSPPVLLNYISAPNVTIASAVVASAAVPGFVPPVSLQYKDSNGVVKSRGSNVETYFDGSIEQDIPTSGLAEMLNVQFFIACQCNPHIVPFFYNSKGGVGRPTRWSSGQQEYCWRGGFLLAALEMYLKNDMKAKFVFLNDLEAAVGFTSTMMTQEYGGSTTVVPEVSFFDYFKLFSDPSLTDLNRYFHVGKVSVYPHCAMIKLHYSIADALDECLSKLEGRTKTRPRSKILTQERNGFARPYSASSLDRHTDLPHLSKTDMDIQASDTSMSEEDEYERNWIYDISPRS